jgi:hypothetical protein
MNKLVERAYRKLKVVEILFARLLFLISLLALHEITSTLHCLNKTLFISFRKLLWGLQISACWMVLAPLSLMFCCLSRRGYYCGLAVINLDPQY